MPTKTLAILLISFSLTLTACIVSPDNPPPTNTPDSGLQIYFPRQPKMEGERAVMEARTGGILILVDNCLRLDRELPSGESYMLIWPPDYNYSFDNNEINILNEEGEIVMSVGDKISIGGGQVPLLLEPIKGQVPAECPEPYWIIGDIDR